MAMLQQMMSGGGPEGMPGAQGQPGAPGDLPPGLANLMSAMGGGGAAPEPSPEQSSAWLWRLVHAICSFGLSLYIVLGIDGVAARRTGEALCDQRGAHALRLAREPRLERVRREQGDGAGGLAAIGLEQGIGHGQFTGLTRNCS